MSRWHKGSIEAVSVVARNVTVVHTRVVWELSYESSQWKPPYNLLSHGTRLPLVEYGQDILYDDEKIFKKSLSHNFF